MSYPSYCKWLIAGLLAAGTGACERNRTTPPPHSTPDTGETAPDARKPPEFNSSGSGQSMPMGQMLAGAKSRQGSPMTSTLPAGHPPIGSMPAGGMAGMGSLPAGHPPIGDSSGMSGMMGGAQPTENMLQLKPPADWSVRKTRPATVAVYGLPKAGAASEDAELAVSYFPGMKNIPLQTQVERWVGQFAHDNGDPKVTQTPLENAPHSTTVVDITGTYKGGAMMMAPAGPPKPAYRMMIAVVETDSGPWFFRLLGPEATVAGHAAEFKQFVRDAK